MQTDEKVDINPKKRRRPCSTKGPATEIKSGLGASLVAIIAQYATDSDKLLQLAQQLSDRDLDDLVMKLTWEIDKRWQKVKPYSQDFKAMLEVAEMGGIEWAVPKHVVNISTAEGYGVLQLIPPDSDTKAKPVMMRFQAKVCNEATMTSVGELYFSDCDETFPFQAFLWTGSGEEPPADAEQDNFVGFAFERSQSDSWEKLFTVASCEDVYQEDKTLGQFFSDSKCLAPVVRAFCEAFDLRKAKFITQLAKMVQQLARSFEGPLSFKRLEEEARRKQMSFLDFLDSCDL